MGKKESEDELRNKSDALSYKKGYEWRGEGYQLEFKVARKKFLGMWKSVEKEGMRRTELCVAVGEMDEVLYISHFFSATANSFQSKEKARPSEHQDPEDRCKAFGACSASRQKLESVEECHKTVSPGHFSG